MRYRGVAPDDYIDLRGDCPGTPQEPKKREPHDG
jgi:hypothetical protein